MKCPYLEEVAMRYCQAYPIKKMIPASSSQLVSPCFSSPEGCAVYKDVTGKSFKTPCQKCPALATADTPPTETEGAEKKYCVWLRQETVSYRLCTRNYDCQSCTFEQMLIEQEGKYVETPDAIKAVEQLKDLPADQRKCKYTVTGKTLYEPCNKNYACWNCATYKNMRSNIIEKYTEEAKSKEHGLKN
jgi:hypothetical protein